MTTALRKKRTYSDEDKRQAVGLYLVLGVMSKVAEQLSIPERTLNTWRTETEWWNELAADAKQATTDRIKASIDKTIDLSFREVQDRLENGDAVLDKKGEIVRKKMSGRDAGIIAGIMVDKRQILSHQPTVISGNVDSRIHEYMSKFAELGKALQARTIEGEVVGSKPNCLLAKDGDG